MENNYNTCQCNKLSIFIKTRKSKTVLGIFKDFVLTELLDDKSLDWVFLFWSLFFFLSIFLGFDEFYKIV